MSMSTETDVAVPESETAMASDTVWRSGMARFGDLVWTNCPEPEPVPVPVPPVLSGDRAKSDAVTPVTSSLKVTL